MGSLEYLSRKAIIYEDIRAQQLQLIDLQKEFESLLHVDAIKKENKFKTYQSKSLVNKITSEDAKIRNRNCFDSLTNLEERINKTLEDDNYYLKRLKEKYEMSRHLMGKTRKIEDKPVTTRSNQSSQRSRRDRYNAGKEIEQTEQITEKKTENVKIRIPSVIIKENAQKEITEKSKNDNLGFSFNGDDDEIDAISPRITPRLKESRSEIVKQMESPPRIIQASEEVVKMRKPAKKANANLGSYDSQDDEIELTSPRITPRLKESRSRMSSMSPSKGISSVLSNPEKSDTSLDNISDDSMNVCNKKNEENIQLELSFQQFLPIFHIIKQKIDKNPKIFAQEYLKGMGLNDSRNNFSQKLSIIKQYLRMSNGAFDDEDVEIKHLGFFIVNQLPKVCLESEFDISLILKDGLDQTIINNKQQSISYKEVIYRIRNAVCKTNQSTQLWNKLSEHFMLLAGNGSVNKRIVADLFAPLMMPLSSTISNEEKISQFLLKFLELMNEDETQITPLKGSSARDTVMFSDEDSFTVSSLSDKISKPISKSNGIASYDQLKASLNLTDGLVYSPGSLGDDDDPNDEMNELFVTSTPLKPTVAPAKTPALESKQRLTNSIRNIDDEFTAITNGPGNAKVVKFQQKQNDSDDDDFDFYQ